MIFTKAKTEILNWRSESLRMFTVQS